MFRSKFINLVTGAEHFEKDSKEKFDFTFEFSGFVIRGEDKFTDDLLHTNVYLYSYVYLPMDVTLTIGGSGDFFNGDSDAQKDKDQFNPKFGIIWNTFPDTEILGLMK